jgi:hypothetical protein
MQMLAQAKEMAGYGIHPNDIWFRTGWFQGADGGWRYEISDAAAAIDRPAAVKKQLEIADHNWAVTTDASILRHRAEKQGISIEQAAAALSQEFNRALVPGALEMARGTSAAKLAAEASHWESVASGGNPKVAIQDVVSHPGLLAAYPDLANRPYEEFPMSVQPQIRGGYDPGTDILYASWLPQKLEKDRATALHELQHAVQAREGWAAGAHGSPTMTPEQFMDYQRTAGEVEARNTEARRNMDVLHRRLTLPWSTMDVPFADQIIPGKPAPPLTPERFQELIDYMRKAQSQR